MKLSISNIAWTPEQDQEILSHIRRQGFSGLEIAPTRLFSESPYEHIKEAKKFSEWIEERYGLSISSMQSIWYGITESIFGSVLDRDRLIDYTKKAIDFASAIGCPNLVFGCPRNRNVPENFATSEYLPMAYEFFDTIGSYAYNSNTYFAIEANPPIYGTNYINSTNDAFEICKQIKNPGIRVNLDVGTMIQNNEPVDIIVDDFEWINHIHISEPYLKPIQKRELHRELLSKLKGLGYDKYISIEMGNSNDVEQLKGIIDYLGELRDGV